jgi:hypothetical protein
MRRFWGSFYPSDVPTASQFDGGSIGITFPAPLHLQRHRAIFRPARNVSLSRATRQLVDRDMGAFAAFEDLVGNEFGLYEEPRR